MNSLMMQMMSITSMKSMQMALMQNNLCGPQQVLYAPQQASYGPQILPPQLDGDGMPQEAPYGVPILPAQPNGDSGAAVPAKGIKLELGKRYPLVAGFLEAMMEKEPNCKLGEMKDKLAKASVIHISDLVLFSKTELLTFRLKAAEPRWLLREVKLVLV
jgi:hypothetical protein